MYSKLIASSLLGGGGILVAVIYGSMTSFSSNDSLLLGLGMLLLMVIPAVLSGVCFGLMISAVSVSSRWAQVVAAVAAVGMFGVTLMTSGYASVSEKLLNWLSPLSWAVSYLGEFVGEGGRVTSVFGSLLALVWFSVVFLAVAYGFLKRQGARGAGQGAVSEMVAG